MKVINVGQECGNYDSLILQAGKQDHKFGKMYFLKERVYLVINKPFTDYSIYKSEDKDDANLAFALTEELKRELDGIMKVASRQFPNLEFKAYDGAKIFIKTGKNCGEIKMNTELRVTIQVYGLFTQNTTGKTFLQMDIMEHQSQKFSFLNRAAATTTTTTTGGVNYEPNSKTWEDFAVHNF
jgi:hypothetical protein